MLREKDFFESVCFPHFGNLRLAASLGENIFKLIMKVMSYYLVRDFDNYSISYLNFYHFEEHLGMGRK